VDLWGGLEYFQKLPMIEPVTIQLRPIARDLRISYRQVEAVVQLLEEGKTVPFIARYRKDQTGGLEEEQIRRIRTLFHQARLLAHRKETILRSLQLQGAWTAELDRKIRSATTSRRLEDLYLPYKPKKDGLATTARFRGLQPLAEEILQAAPSCANLEARAADFVNPDKQVRTPADALLGAGHILAEMISEHAELRKKLREVFYRTGRICSQLLETVSLPPGWETDKKKSTASGLAPSLEIPPAENPPTEKHQETSPEAKAEAMASEEVQKISAGEQSQVSAASGGTQTTSPDSASADSAGQAQAAEAGGPGFCSESNPTSLLLPETPGLPKSPESSESFGAVGGEAGRQDVGQEDGSGQGDSSATSAQTVPFSQHSFPDAPQKPDHAWGSEPELVPAPSPASSAGVTGATSGGWETGDSAQSAEEEKLSDSASGSPLLPCQEAEAGLAAEVAGGSGTAPASSGPVFSGSGQESGLTAGSEVQPAGAAAPRSSHLSQTALRTQQKELKKQQLLERRLRAYQDFFDFQEPIRKISPYRVLTLNRAERQKILRVWMECDLEGMRQVLYQECIPADHPHADFLRGCAEDALQRLLLPSLEREARRELTERAEAHAVKVVSNSLRKMLLQRPVRDKRILAVHPGLGNGCVLVALDEFGNLLEHAKLCLVGRGQDRETARQKVLQLIRRYRIGLVVIGNSRGSRIFEKFLADLLNTELKTEDVRYGMVSDIGAKAYARSMVGQEEFPYYDVRVRMAISIGRRVMDPLSELVKIDPSLLVTGVYQHDVRAKHLRPLLEEVVESCVNRVGVDVNTAHPWLLRYVSGLNMVLARRVEEYRREHGQFRTRTELKEIAGFGEGTFELAAPFLKILHGPEPLDRTAIHPDCYNLARKILEKVSAQPEDLWNPAKALTVQQQLGQLDAQTLAQELGAGVWMVRQVLGELRRAGRDIRDDFPAPSFKRIQLRPEDLKPDMELSGTVVHITDFGAFVDIGVGNNGLVHISQMATQYVRDPREVVSVGDNVKVWVLQVDLERRRISLSMIPPDQRAQAAQTARAEKAASEKTPSARPPRRTEVGTGRAAAASATQPTAKETSPRAAGERPPAKDRPARSSTRQFRSKAPPPPPPKLSEAVKQGKQPMRTFAELLQFFQLTRQQQAAQVPKPEPTAQQSPASPLPAAGPTPPSGLAEAPPMGGPSPPPASGTSQAAGVTLPEAPPPSPATPATPSGVAETTPALPATPPSAAPSPPGTSPSPLGAAEIPPAVDPPPSP